MAHQDGDETRGRERVFISYARKDGEEFAARLCARLDAAGVGPVWRDRDRMYGGHNWWLQITNALERVEFLVLVITEAAIESRVVHREWRRGRQEGVCVFGVRGSTDVKLGQLPGWIGSKHIYNLGLLEDDEDGPDWEKFKNDLSQSCRQPRVPFMAGDLPAEYVARRDELEAVKNGLLDRGREEAVAITAALSGAGGFGKTTLAKALCQDDDVQTFFHDGVMWVTLGEKPGDLRPRVDALIRSLTGQDSGFADLESAVARLRELLADRVLLIVVDDVWNETHLRPFMEGGPRCTRLITTRVLTAVPAKSVKVKVDAMKPDEAVSLLRFDLPESNGREFLALASDLGEWPLLLKLVNGVLRYRVHDARQPLADALAAVARDLEESGLVAFDAAEPEGRHQAVEATLNVSLTHLKEDERRRFEELAVFPEDVDVPLATLERFWGLGPGKTEYLCARFDQLSLLHGLDLGARRLRLHDVIRDFLIGRQGEGLPAAHARLLEAHRPVRVGAQPSAADWSRLSEDEPYLWDFLAYHLVEARLEDELHALLSSETPDGRNIWHEVKSDVRGMAPYLADVNDALGLAARASSRSTREGGAASGLALEVRYHLVRASINSLASNIPPPLLAAVAANKVMPASKLMAHVRGLSQGSLAQSYTKIHAAGAVSEHFEEPLRSEFLRIGLAVAAETSTEEERAKLLVQCSLSATESLVGDVLRLMREVKSPGLFDQLLAYAAGLHARHGKADEGFTLFDEMSPVARRNALTLMTPYLNAESARRAAGLAEALPEPENDYALRSLVPRLAQVGEAGVALGLAATIKDPISKGDALSEAAQFFAGEEVERALGLAADVQDYTRRVEAQARLAQGLPEPRRSQLFELLLDEVGKDYYKEDLYAQGRLMRWLPRETILGEKVGQMVEWYLSEKDHREREVLNAFYIRLAELGCFDEALRIMNEAEWDSTRLAGVAPYLSVAQLDKATELVSRLDGEYRRESTLVDILARKAQLGGAREALAQALLFENDNLRDRLLDAVAEHLDGDALRLVLRSQKKVEDSQARDDCGLLMAAYAPHALLPAAIATLQAGTGEEVQALSLERMGRRLSPEALKWVFAEVEYLIDLQARAEARLTLAPYLDDEDRADVVNAALGDGWGLGKLSPGLTSLVGLLPRLDEVLGARVRAFVSEEIWKLLLKDDGSINSPGLLAHFVPLLVAIGETDKALAAARRVKDDERMRLVALARLEPHLAPRVREEVLGELVAWIGRNDNQYTTVVTFGKAARELSPELLREVLRVLNERCDPRHIVSELVTLSVRLAEVGHAEEALALAHKIDRGKIYEFASALTGVAKHLPEPHKERALSDALEAACRAVNPVNPLSGRPDWRARLLARLAEQLEQLPPRTLYELWRNAGRLLSGYPREELLYDLGALAPVLDGLGQARAIEDVWDATAAVSRWWP